MRHDGNRDTAEHLRLINEVIAELDSWPAEVGALEYRYETFGCWSLTVRRNGQRTRFDFDGKDRYLGAERLLPDAGDFSKPPKSLGGITLKSGLTGDSVRQVITFVRKHVG
jgi:hypothetical protein